MADLLDLPDDASWPRHMSAPHPDAVGSFGQDCEAWLKGEYDLTLRWWQRLAVRRQLECDQDGRLLWRTILESTPRRSGKSVRLRAMALWRVDHPEQFGEVQLCLHTGRDLPIAKEIHRRAWRWAEARGWSVRRQNGNEEIERPDGSRWIVRGRDSVYGYDTTLGMVDESWDVGAAVVDEGLEPSLMERQQPQLLLTSTAHRRATSLMRRRIDTALAGILAGDPDDTLLMLWGADKDDDIGDPEVWRRASPHWTEDRRRTISGKLERAMRGEADPEADDVDAIEGFRAQYLNIWPSSVTVSKPGQAVVTPADWEALEGFEAVGVPDCVAVESWYERGCSVAAASRLSDGSVGVAVHDFADVPSGAAWVASCGASRILAGKSIARQVPGSEPTGGTTRQAVIDLRRLIDDHRLVHDDSAELTEQVLALRISPSPDGPRLRSTGRADAVKALSWAAGGVAVVVDMPAIF